jgi:hypothetical protein
MNLIKIGCEDVEWFEVAHNRVQWLVVANMTVNFGFHKRQGNCDQLRNYQLLKKLIFAISIPE